MHKELVRLNGQKIWIDSFPKKTYRWPTGIRKVLKITRRMKIRATIRYHPTPVNMAIIKKPRNDKYWWGCGEKRTFVLCCWECILLQAHGKQYWSSSKIKNKTTVWSNSFTSVYFIKENKSTNSKTYLYLHVHCSIICTSQDIKTTQMFTNRWTDKDVRYIYI